MSVTPAAGAPSAAALPPAAPLRPPLLASLLGGALAGLSVDLLFYPLDTLKTRLQARQGFWAAGGFKHAYRGVGSVAVGSAPGAAIFFLSYESLQPLLRDAGLAHGAALHMAAASVAEVAACLVRVPTEVVKSRQQAAVYGTHVSSSSKALSAVLQEHGVRGLYRGFAGTVGREIPFTCIQFPLYEFFKLQIARSPTFAALRTPSAAGTESSNTRQLPTWQAGLAGSAAGGIAAALTTPLDVVKTRIMLERRAPGTLDASMPAGANVRIVATLLHVLRTEGFGALWRGVVPRTLWISGGGFVFLGTAHAVIGTLAEDERRRGKVQ